jgi:hypothetical protein
MGWAFLFAEGGRGAYGWGAGEGYMGGSPDGGREGGLILGNPMVSRLCILKIKNRR